MMSKIGLMMIGARFVEQQQLRMAHQHAADHQPANVNAVHHQGGDKDTAERAYLAVDEVEQADNALNRSVTNGDRGIGAAHNGLILPDTLLEI